jgi:hypothetical protein
MDSLFFFVFIDNMFSKCTCWNRQLKQVPEALKNSNTVANQTKIKLEKLKCK